MSESAFLAHIIEHHDDDAPRLVFADWLDEQDRPPLSDRAEFIRAQCDLASLHPTDERWPALSARARELLDRYRAVWLGGVGRWAHSWEFRRGFVELVGMRPSDLLANADDIFAEHPVRTVRLIRSTPLPPGWFSRTFWRRVRELDATGFGITNATVAEIAVAPALGGLVSLSLSGNPGLSEPAIAALADSPHLLGLQRLHLAGTGLTWRSPIVRRWRERLGNGLVV